MKGLRFHKSVRLPLGFRLNFSKSGIGWSTGIPGFRFGRDARGRTYKSLGLLGTGLSYREYDSGVKDTRNGSAPGPLVKRSPQSLTRGVSVRTTPGPRCTETARQIETERADLVEYQRELAEGEAELVTAEAEGESTQADFYRWLVDEKKKLIEGSQARIQCLGNQYSIDQLDDEADELDKQAERLDNEAGRLEKQAQQIENSGSEAESIRDARQIQICKLQVESCNLNFESCKLRLASHRISLKSAEAKGDSKSAEFYRGLVEKYEGHVKGYKDHVRGFEDHVNLWTRQYETNRLSEMSASTATRAKSSGCIGWSVRICGYVVLLGLAIGMFRMATLAGPSFLTLAFILDECLYFFAHSKAGTTYEPVDRVDAVYRRIRLRFEYSS